MNTQGCDQKVLRASEHGDVAARKARPSPSPAPDVDELAARAVQQSRPRPTPKTRGPGRSKKAGRTDASVIAGVAPRDAPAQEGPAAPARSAASIAAWGRPRPGWPDAVQQRYVLAPFAYANEAEVEASPRRARAPATAVAFGRPNSGAPLRSPVRCRRRRQRRRYAGRGRTSSRDPRLDLVRYSWPTTRGSKGAARVAGSAPTLAVEGPPMSGEAAGSPNCQSRPGPAAPPRTADRRSARTRPGLITLTLR